MTEKKRKFENVVPNDAGIEYVRASQLASEAYKGEVLQGTFIEEIPNRLDERKMDYVFEDERGQKVIINGSGNLAFSMQNVDAGEFVMVEYLGKQVIQKGTHKGREAHNWRVQRAVD